MAPLPREKFKHSCLTSRSSAGFGTISAQSSTTTAATSWPGRSALEWPPESGLPTGIDCPVNWRSEMAAKREKSEDIVSKRRARRCSLICFEDLCAHVNAGFKIGWTPEQIAGRLGYDDQPMRVSHETIYAYANSAATTLHPTPKRPGSQARLVHP